MNKPALLNVEDAAKYLGISERTLYDLIEPKGPIPRYQLKKRITRLSTNDLDNYIRKCRYDTFEIKSVSGSSLKPQLQGSESELLKFFQKRGLNPKRKPSTPANPAGSAPKQKASNVHPLPLSKP